MKRSGNVTKKNEAKVESEAEKKARIKQARALRHAKEQAELLNPRWEMPVEPAGTNHAEEPPQVQWNWDDPLSMELIRERWDDYYLYRR